MILWLKALHLIAVVAWFAGLFYMFRLFVYHAENADKPEVAEVLKGMAYRLYRVITTPAMIASFVFGLGMIALHPPYLALGWFQAKLVLLLALGGYHGYIGKVRRRFAADDIYLTSRQCRLRNEIPTLFLIAIVLLAVLKPAGT